MKYGVHLPSYGAYRYQHILKFAELTESLNFDSIWVGDHFFIENPNSLLQAGGVPKEPNKLDSTILLTGIAMVTKSLALGSRVCPISFHNPAKLAMQYHTLNEVSDGRIILGLGVGRRPREALAYGYRWNKYATRIDQLEEGIKIIRKLWTEKKSTFRGRHYRLMNAPLSQTPESSAHLDRRHFTLNMPIGKQVCQWLDTVIS